MTREELLAVLRECRESDDEETSHVRADEALLEFIHDAVITRAFEDIPKWYA
jgi:hypothetical protein